MNKLGNWLGQRLPFAKWWTQHATGYYVPKNLNFWYCFGVLSLLVLAIQVVSGIWLTMYYTPTAEQAFASIQMIMRDIPYGWLFRYAHACGASAMFIVIYLHMLRSLLYGSYQKPRELVWLLGMLLYILLIAEAILGYLLPWGQLSYWGTQVLTSLMSLWPDNINTHITLWLRGDYTISSVSLHRFFALHVIGLPLLLFFVVWLHLVALREVGSNNPDGIDLKNSDDKNGIPLNSIPFHPHYTVKDLLYVALFLLVFCSILFFAPEMGGYFLEPANSIPANPLQTPEHIVPLWYLAPFYAMLRAVPDKLAGVIIVTVALLIWFCLPWLDRSRVRSIRFRGIYTKYALTSFCVSFLSLIYLGHADITSTNIILARICTCIYFAYFVFMPFYTHFEKTKPLVPSMNEPS